MRIVSLLDPSEHLRPEVKFAHKPLEKFRNYDIDANDPIKERVRKFYHLMHANQTVDFVKSQREKWMKFNHFKATIRQTLEKLNDLVDESDPDVELPNIVHAFQTAERIREEHPDLGWFQLTGLIHDMGKVMAFYDEPQWAVTGDTFVVGCQWPQSIVYRQTSFKDNTDAHIAEYNTENGIYEKNCGLENVLMAWGHDEYLYQVLKHNKTTLPEEALCMIRFHSFYPWHTGGDYNHLMSDKDKELKEWVLKFNKFDLYTKSSKIPNIENLWPYYEKLIDQYIPGVLEW